MIKQFVTGLYMLSAEVRRNNVTREVCREELQQASDAVFIAMTASFMALLTVVTYKKLIIIFRI